MIETEITVIDPRRLLPTRPSQLTRGGLDLYPSRRFSGDTGTFLTFWRMTESVTRTNGWVRAGIGSVVSTQLLLEYLDDQDKITRALLCAEKDQI